mgnify:CR=1 FL=1
MDTVLNVALIGFGRFGKKYFKSIKKNKRLSLKVIFRKKIFSKNKYHKLSLKNIKSNKIKAAIVCTPVKTHFEVSKLFIKNRIPIILEKPAANNIKQIKKLIDLTKKYKSSVIVNHSDLFNQNLNLFISKIKLIGKINYFSCNFGKLSKIYTDKDFLPHNSIVEFVLRPTEISQNTSTEIEYLSHIINTRNLKKNSLISRMQCTSPFQSVASMKLSVEKLEAHLTKFDSVQLVSPSSPSIHKAMLKCEKSGLLSPATNLGSIGPSNRQNLEKTYFRSNFYVTSVQQILSGNLLGSRSYGLECEEREVIDIDAHFDLEIVRALAVSNTDWLEM